MCSFVIHFFRFCLFAIRNDICEMWNVEWRKSINIILNLISKTNFSLKLFRDTAIESTWIIGVYMFEKPLLSNRTNQCEQMFCIVVVPFIHAFHLYFCVRVYLFVAFRSFVERIWIWNAQTTVVLFTKPIDTLFSTHCQPWSMTI